MSQPEVVGFAVDDAVDDVGSAKGLLSLPDSILHLIFSFFIGKTSNLAKACRSTSQIIDQFIGTLLRNPMKVTHSWTELYRTLIMVNMSQFAKPPQRLKQFTLADRHGETYVRYVCGKIILGVTPIKVDIQLTFWFRQGDTLSKSTLLEDLFGSGKFKMFAGVKLIELLKRINVRVRLDRDTYPLQLCDIQTHESLWTLGFPGNDLKELKICLELEQDRVFVQVMHPRVKHHEFYGWLFKIYKNDQIGDIFVNLKQKGFFPPDYEFRCYKSGGMFPVKVTDTAGEASGNAAASFVVFA